MEEPIVKEFREKIFEPKLSKDTIWAKTYLKTVVADTETSTWTYEEEKIKLEVDNSGHLLVADDDRWFFIHNIKALELMKEAIDIAINKQRINEAV
jgi:hypothetical protein